MKQLLLGLGLAAAAGAVLVLAAAGRRRRAWSLRLVNPVRTPVRVKNLSTGRSVRVSGWTSSSGAPGT